MVQHSHFVMGGASMYQKADGALMMNAVQRVPYYRRLWRDHGADLLFFDPRGIDWDRRMIEGLLLHNGRWMKGLFPFPQTVYNRCYPEPTAVIGRFQELIGVPRVFNDRTHLDKWEVYEQLQISEVGDYLPSTYRYTQDDLAELLGTHPSFVLKPRLGHGGAGVFKVTLLSPNVLIFVSQLGVPIPLLGQEFYLKLLTEIAPPVSYIAQQYIVSIEQDERKFDVRIVMQKNGRGEWEVGGELSRITRGVNLLTNHYHAIAAPLEVISQELLSTLRAISQVVAETLDGKLATLGEIGVDFLIDEEGRPWILEVNGKPDKGLFRHLDDADTMRRIYLNPLRYQKYLLSLTQVP